MASGTLNFSSNDTARWFDGVAEDGEGGSTDLTNAVIRVGLLSNANGSALNVPIEWHNSDELANFNGFNGLTTFDPSFNDFGWAGFVIKSADHSKFQIDEFRFYDWGGWTGELVNVIGYRDGQQVASSSFASNAGDYFISVNLNASFDRVDEIRITYADGGGWGSINNIQIAEAYPTTSRPDLTSDSDTGRSNADNLTRDTTPTFTGTATAYADVHLFDDRNNNGLIDAGEELGTTTADGSGAWVLTPTLASGSYTIKALATVSGVGNSSASAALTVQVDTEASTTESTSLLFSADTGAASTDFVTRTAGQTISGTLSAALIVGERVEVSLDNGGSWTTASAATGSDTWSLATTLTSGTNTLLVRVVDAVDNYGPVFFKDYTLDTVAPSVTISSSASQLKAGESATITFTFSEDPGLSFSWDGVAGDVTVTGGTLSAISGTGLTRTATFTPDTAVNSGTASITINLGAYADLAGNVGAAGATPSLRFDTLTPATPSAPDLTSGSDSGLSASDNVTNSNTLVLTGTAETGATITLYDTDGITAIGTGTATEGIWSITTSPLAEGVHTIVARASDGLGNRSSVSAGLSVIIDGTAPTFAQSSPMDNATNVPASANLVLIFSDIIRAGTGTIELHASSGGLIESFDMVTSSRISIAGNVLTIDPTTPLSSGSGYYLTVAAGALKDPAGNDFAGITDTSAINFTTISGGEDGLAGPTVTPNEQGGRDITVTDPSQLTVSLGTSGIDHVYYSGSGTVVLPDTIENITLRGSANVVGNALGNDMRSGIGQNVLNGMGGNDTLYGYHGSDWVYGGSGNDIMSGSSGQDWVYGGSGSDTVNGGSGNDWVWGDAGRDTVYGGLGNDTVNGGAGNDILYGNAGRDTFVFDTKLNNSSNVDLIKNFSIRYDSIWLDNAVFTNLGRGSDKGVKLASDMFVTSTTAQDAQDRIVYDRETGSLYYDRDGTGSAAQVKFATLSNKAKLTYHDFFVV